MLALQNYMDLVKVEPGSDGETCRDGYQTTCIKAKDVTDIKLEEHPVLITSPLIKDEQEVCLCANLGTFHKYIDQCFLNLRQLPLQVVGTDADCLLKITHTQKCMQVNRRNVIPKVKVTITTSFLYTILMYFLKY
jgi:hypothetical protein